MVNLDNIKIEKVWFDAENIYLLTNDGTQKSHPLCWFATLWNATPEDRNDFTINRWGNGIHWEKLNEDLSLEGFYFYKPQQVQKKSIFHLVRKAAKVAATY
ncbi:hypothetical protein FACS1894162_2290 [Bacteroidia bacterium]|nr:hypothetical protein FACS1894162_2290 [Bacteroidia bacterium]